MGGRGRLARGMGVALAEPRERVAVVAANSEANGVLAATGEAACGGAA